MTSYSWTDALKPKPGAPLLPAASTSGRKLTDILQDDEEPSTFESFFRFLGRPGFIVRGAITGDFEGVARNVGQFAQEVGNPLAILNQSMNPSNLFGTGDLTRAKDRPEFTDVLHRWGVVSDPSMLGPWEKFGLDVVGGAVTDPTSLLGGGGAVRGVTARTLASGTVGEARQGLYQALRRGGGQELKSALDQAEAMRLGTWARKQAVPVVSDFQRRAAGLRDRVAAMDPSLTTSTRLPVPTPDLGPLPTSVDAAMQEFRAAVAAKKISPRRAATVEMALRGRAAQDVWEKIALEEGVDLRRAAQSTFRPTSSLNEWMGGAPVAVEEELASAFGQNPARRFAVLRQGAEIPATEIGKDVTRRLAQGQLKREGMSGFGRKFDIIYPPHLETVAARLRGTMREIHGRAHKQTDPSVMLNVLRDLGYSDDWSIPFMEEAFMDASGTPLRDILGGVGNTTDEMIRLGNDMPVSLANKGIEALVKRGMSPGGGLSFTPLWSDTLGKAIDSASNGRWAYRNGFVFVPWGDIGNMTGPGALRQIALSLGWQGHMLDDAIGRGASHVIRKVYDRFHWGKMGTVPREVAGKIESEMNRLHADYAAREAQIPREIYEAMGTLAPEIRQAITKRQFLKESEYHRARNAPIDRSLNVAALREVVRVSEGSALPAVRRAGRAAKELVDQYDEWEGATRTWRDEMGRLDREWASASRVAVNLNDLDIESAVIQSRLHNYMDRMDQLDELSRQWDPFRGMGDDFAPGEPQLSPTPDVNWDHPDLQEGVDGGLDGMYPEADAPFFGVPLQPVTGVSWDQIREARSQANSALEAYREAVEGIRPRLEAEGIDPRTFLWDRSIEARLTAAHREADRIHQIRSGVVSGHPDFKYAGAFNAARDSAAMSLFAGRLTRELIDEVVEEFGDPLLRPQIEKAVKFSHEQMRKIAVFMRYSAKNAEDLLAGNPLPRQAWEFIDDANPFYLPHQMDPALVEALANPAWTDAQRVGLRSVFDKAREYGTIEEFEQAIRNMADELGIEGDDISELVQTDYAALTMQRMLAFERSKLKGEAYKAMIKLAGKEGISKTTYEEYLLGALSGLSPRGVNSAISFLAGGKFEIPLGANAASIAAWEGKAEFLNRSADDPNFVKVVPHRSEGGYVLRLNWPGLNRVYKPMLTSIPTNIRFRFRNLLSCPLQAMFHPDLKFAGVAPIWNSIKDDGAVRWSIAKFKKWAKSTDKKQWAWDGPDGLPTLDSAKLHAMKPDQRLAWATQTFTRAMSAPSAAERIACRNALGGLKDVKVGPYTFDQLWPVLDSVIGDRPRNQADLTEGIKNMQDLYWVMDKAELQHKDPNYLGMFVRKFRNFVELGEQWSNEIEVQWRSLTALRLAELGKTPLEIVTETNRLMVDYSRQSEIEGWIRAVIPFARYMIGATAWTADMLSNPSGAGKGLMGRAVSPQMLGAATRSLGGEEGDESNPALTPRHVKETLALPLPWKDREGNVQFLTSLGFPQEVVINALSLASARPESIQHVALGGLQPALKLPMEAIAGRSFYFGTDFGSYRKAPAIMRPFAQEVPGPEGTTRYEVPGVVNELETALPTAGVMSTINRLADDRQGILSRIANAMTGFRIQSSDQEAELQRRISDYLRRQTRSGSVGELEVFFQRLKPEDVPPDVVEVLDALEQMRAERRKKGK